MESSNLGVPSIHRWRALRTVSTILRVFAWLILVLGGLGVLIGAVATGNSDDGGAGEAVLTLIFGLIAVGFYALLTFAAAELIMIGIAVEENTRLTASALAPKQALGGAVQTQGPERGWYPDPDDSAKQRYWDGSKWGETRPTPQ